MALWIPCQYVAKLGQALMPDVKKIILDFLSFVLFCWRVSRSHQRPRDGFTASFGGLYLVRFIVALLASRHMAN